MEYAALVGELMKLWWVVPILAVIAIFKSAWFKGVMGEAQVKLAALVRLPKDQYHRLHNVTLATADGTTQIDHVFISRFGIFVVETKNMKGWIFGGQNQKQWTQKIYRQSFRFQNPLRQNYKHVKALEQACEVPEGTIHSVVVFTGASTFKTPMPKNVTAGGRYTTYIRSFTEALLSDDQVKQAVEQIEAARLAPNRQTQRRHVQNLNARDDSVGSPICPRCGNAMVLRKAKRGASAGNQFWGCSAYPRCRQMLDA